MRATWAPRGQTPCFTEPVACWQRLSGIGLVLTDPQARRLRWLLAVHRGTITSPRIGRFLNALKRHRRGPVILPWDRLPAHRSRHTRHALRTHRSWLNVEWLPPYACELNPVEPLWGHFDQTTLANTPMEELGRLRHRLYRAIRRMERHPRIGRGFLRYTDLF